MRKSLKRRQAEIAVRAIDLCGHQLAGGRLPQFVDRQERGPDFCRVDFVIGLLVQRAEDLDNPHTRLTEAWQAGRWRVAPTPAQG